MQDMAHVVRELDLSAYCRHDTIISRVSAVPGLKTSTAFFIFLRANLVASFSGESTPIVDPISSSTLLSLSPLLPSPLAAEPPEHTISDDHDHDHDHDLPPLSTDILDTRTDKENALRLIADSVVQQRQTSACHLLSHPFLLLPFIAVLAGACRYTWTCRRDVSALLVISCSCLIATYLLGIRHLTGGYLEAAEELRWSWLSPGSSSHASPSEQDLVLGARVGRQLVGTLVLRLEPSPSSVLASGSGHKRRSRTSLLRGGRGVIRAWTVAPRYRGRGVARDLLHAAVRLVRERCGRDAEVGFAAEHANSKVVLPEPFNAPFRRSERRAAKSLEKVLAEWEGTRRRRRP